MGSMDEDGYEKVKNFIPVPKPLMLGEIPVQRRMTQKARKNAFDMLKGDDSSDDDGDDVFMGMCASYAARVCDCDECVEDPASAHADDVENHSDMEGPASAHVGSVEGPLSAHTGEIAEYADTGRCVMRLVPGARAAWHARIPEPPHSEDYVGPECEHSEDLSADVMRLASGVQREGHITDRPAVVGCIAPLWWATQTGISDVETTQGHQPTYGSDAGLAPVTDEGSYGQDHDQDHQTVRMPKPDLESQKGAVIESKTKKRNRRGKRAKKATHSAHMQGGQSAPAVQGGQSAPAVQKEGITEVTNDVEKFLKAVGVWDDIEDFIAPITVEENQDELLPCTEWQDVAVEITLDSGCCDHVLDAGEVPGYTILQSADNTSWSATAIRSPIKGRYTSTWTQ